MYTFQHNNDDLNVLNVNIDLKYGFVPYRPTCPLNILNLLHYIELYV